MPVKYLLPLCALITVTLLGDIKEEFNIKGYWYEGMSWKHFLKIRNALQRDALVPYVDKIQQQQLAKEVGLEVPKTFIATHEMTPIAELLKNLPSYVAKMTHLSYSEGLIIVKDGINIITGEPITPEEVEQRIFASLSSTPRQVESWALHQVKPGFLVQEYIPNRMEVKIQTIWGKAVIGEWRGGESYTATTRIWGRYDRAGNKVDGKWEAPEWWPKAIEAAELMAKDTDALRVDFLVRENGELLLNELEIWPESNWTSMIPAIETALNDGYRTLWSK